MSTSAVPAVIDYLVTACKAAATLGANPTVPVTVIDGPLVGNDWPQNALWIGVEPAFLTQSAPAAAQSATATQQWTGPGSRKRDEHLTVHCIADAWNGSTDIRSARLQAYAIMSAFEDLTRVDANAGGTVLFTDSGVTNSNLVQSQTSSGARAMVSFDFACFARIGS